MFSPLFAKTKKKYHSIQTRFKRIQTKGSYSETHHFEIEKYEMHRQISTISKTSTFWKLAFSKTWFSLKLRFLDLGRSLCGTMMVENDGFLGRSPVVLGQYWLSFILIVRFLMTFYWMFVCKTLNQSLICDIGDLFDALKMFHSARVVSCRVVSHRVATWRHDEG